MAYTRRNTTDGVTVMNKDLYDNLQDGIEQFGITPQMFGAVGDGIHDDTEPIRKAILSLKSGMTLYFPIGVYKFVPKSNEESLIYLEGLKNVIIDFNFSKIIVEPNGFSHYNLLYIKDCENFKIINGVLVGDRILHSYTGGSTHEFGYGIFIYSESSITSGIIYNCDVNNFTGDSIVLKNSSFGGKLVIENSELHHNRRQGISILDSDEIIIKNTYIHHIGTFDDIAGASPMSGIDLEPASGSKTINKVSIENCVIKDISNYGIIGGTNEGQTLKELSILNSIIFGTISCKATKVNDIINLTYIGTVGKTGTITSDTTYYIKNSNLTLSGGELYTANLYGIYNSFISSLEETPTVLRKKLVNCSIEHLTIKSANSLPFEGAFNCTFNNCKFFFYTNPIDGIFSECSFFNSSLSEGSNNPSGVKFFNCVLDSKFFTLGVYNNCTIISEL